MQYFLLRLRTLDGRFAIKRTIPVTQKLACYCCRPSLGQAPPGLRREAAIVRACAAVVMRGRLSRQGGGPTGCRGGPDAAMTAGDGLGLWFRRSGDTMYFKDVQVLRDPWKSPTGEETWMAGATPPRLGSRPGPVRVHRTGRRPLLRKGLWVGVAEMQQCRSKNLPRRDSRCIVAGSVSVTGGYG